VDEAMMRGAEAGKFSPAIVVGVWSTDRRRLEYSPWGEGPAYARFLIEELTPQVNAKYRTLTGPENTGVMGSSMGGLISFHLAWKHPDVFGRAGCISTHWVWDGTDGRTGPPLILNDLTPENKFPATVRTYFDFGTAGVDAPYEPLQTQVTAWLEA